MELAKFAEEIEITIEDGGKIYLPAHTPGIRVWDDEFSAYRWYLPTLNPPDDIVIGTGGKTFAEVWEAHGLDPLELAVPYTGSMHGGSE